MKRIKNLKTRGIGTFGVEVDASVEQAVSQFLENDVSALIVYDRGKMAGIFTKNDLVRCCAANPDCGVRTLDVKDFMKSDVFTTTIDADLDEVIDTMVDRGFRHVPVLDGDRVVGMVTSMDILVHRSEDLTHERDEMRRYICGSY